MRYHIESIQEMENIVGIEKISGGRIGNGNYINIYDVDDPGDIAEIERMIAKDENIVKYYTS